MRQFPLILQIILTHVSYISCQQFTFGNNPAIPPRYLVPGSYATPINQPQLQQKRLLQNPENENPTIKLRKPSRSRAGISSLPIGSPPANSEILPPSSGSFRSQLTGDNSPALPIRPITEDEEGTELEEEDTPLVSTISPITTPSKSFSSSLQFRPTNPQFIGNTNTNIIDEEETDYRTTKTQTSLLPTTVHDTPQFQRKQLGSRIIPNYKQQSSQPETVENKIIKQYERPLLPAKTKFEKSDIPEKRARKPVAQVLRRYREDNPDGSITWGFENDDGSYKEETIGNDCVTRGKYGYIDPDGVRREYSYSSGLPCDKNKLEQNEEANSPAGYIDYSSNKVVLPNGDSVDLDNMVKNRARKPVPKFKNQS